MFCQLVTISEGRELYVRWSSEDLAAHRFVGTGDVEGGYGQAASPFQFLPSSKACATVAEYYKCVGLKDEASVVVVDTLRIQEGRPSWRRPQHGEVDPDVPRWVGIPRTLGGREADDARPHVHKIVIRIIEMTEQREATYIDVVS